MPEEIATTTQEKLEEILSGVIVWPQSLHSRTQYRRTHDDNDGKKEQCICVEIGPDGDTHCCQNIDSEEEIDEERSDPSLLAGVQFPLTYLRYRNSFGGGRSPRVYNALLILALAIHFDNQDDPNHNPDAE